MYHIKEDKRSLHTAKSCYQSLISLLEKKPYESINVSELVRVAEVGRSSFYRNFDSLVDVLSWKTDVSFNQVINDYLASKKGETREMLIYVFSYWEKRSEVLEALIRIKRIDVIYDSFSKCSAEVMSLLPLGNKEKEYFLAIRLGIFVSVLLTWIKNGKRESVDELAKIVEQSVSPNN